MRRRRAWVLCALLLLTMLFPGCAEAGSNKEFYIGLNGLPASFDPQLEAGRGGASLCSAIYACLLRINSEGELVSDCAERYEISTDKKTYTFYLREDLVWSNGQLLTSADFAFGLKRCLSPETGSAIANELLSIQGAENFHKTGKGSLGLDASDPSKLVIRLSQPDDGLLRVLATPYTAPCNEAFFESTGGRYGLSLNTSLTNGRFTPASFGSKIVVKKNKLFYDAKNVIPSSITFLDISQQASESIVKSIAEGDLDFALSATLPYHMPENVSAASLKGSVWVLSFSSINKVTSLPSLRKALTIGGLSLVQADHNTGYFLPPQYRQQVLEGAGTVHATNIASAKAALEEVLTALGKSSLPKIICLVPDREDARILSDALVESWQRQLGIFISREFVSQNEIEAKIKTGNYQIALSLYEPSFTSPSSFYSSLINTYGLTGDIGFMANYDKIIKSGSGDEAKISKSVEQLLFSQDGIYPLDYGETYFIKNSKVQNEIFIPESGIIDLTFARK